MQFDKLVSATSVHEKPARRAREQTRVRKGKALEALRMRVHRRRRRRTMGGTLRAMNTNKTPGATASRQAQMQRETRTWSRATATWTASGGQPSHAASPTHTLSLSLCPLCLHPCLNEKASSTCDASFLEPYLSLTDCFSLRLLLEPLTLCVCCNPREKADACTAPMHRGAAAMVLGPWALCYRRFDSGTVRMR